MRPAGISLRRGALAAALLACVAGVAPAALEETPEWPRPPDPPRLRFLAAHSGLPPAPAGGGLRKLLRLLLGVDAARLGRRRLVNPTGLFAGGGMIYAADPGSRAVLRYDEARGKPSWLEPGRGFHFVSPVAVAAAPDGRVFVADSALGKVLILEASGKLSGELRGDPEGMSRPAALALSADRVYVSDPGEHRVSAYGLDGLFLFSFGRRGSGEGEFNFPTYLWFDRASRRLWVCDSGNFRIQAFDPEGKPSGGFGQNGDRPGYLARPRGLALDSDGNVYSVDGAMEALQVFDQAGRLLLFVGREGGQPGEFSLPGGVFVDERDRVLVADTFNGRIQVFQYLKEGKP